MKLDNTKKIGIVGLGLIGGSYAIALRSLGYEVGAIARRKETIDYALENGIIDHGTIEVCEEYVSQFDIIVFALYPKVFIEWIEKYQSYIKSGAIITDVTGVKCSIVYKIQDILRDDVEFIAAHPMAGRESSGVENATKDIFPKANYIVTPTEKNTEEAIETCKELGRVLGFGTIATLTPEKHDEMIGFLSQLTHCIAVSLMTSRDTTSFTSYTGDSFRDLTRIAKINDEMWSELFLLNKEMLLSQMDIFMSSFEKLRDCIANDKKEEMKAIMRESTEHRKLFDKKQ